METRLEGPDLRTARRERRALKRRAEILSAALRVFERVGFEGATTRLLAEEADVAEGTLYNYFPDKAELCIEALKQGSGLEALAEIMRRPNLAFEARLADLGRWRAERRPRQTAQMELLAEILARPKLRARYEAEIWEPAASELEAALVASGEPLAAPPAMAARILMSTLLGLWLMSLADPRLAALLDGDGGAGLHDIHALLWRGLKAL
jgi:AcrR family transcriptional regulator